MTTGKNGNSIIGQLNDSGEWYTPHWIIDLVRCVLGEIDLDPASSEKANEYIKAHTIFTRDDDGLSRPWFGNVFVNPPYQGNVSKWAAKFMYSRERTTLKNGILLVNANFGYNWFNDVIYDSSVATCVLRDLVEFIPADGQKATHAKRATALIYVGKSPVYFKRIIRSYGKILA